MEILLIVYFSFQKPLPEQITVFLLLERVVYGQQQGFNPSFPR